MTAENIYLYLFLVGVFFAIGNIAISGIGHMLGGLSGGHTGVGGEHSIDTDGNIELGDHGGMDSAGFDSHGGAGYSDHGAEFGDHGAGFNHGVDTGDTIFIDHGGVFIDHGDGIDGVSGGQMSSNGGHGHLFSSHGDHGGGHVGGHGSHGGGHVGGHGSHGGGNLIDNHGNVIIDSSHVIGDHSGDSAGESGGDGGSELHVDVVTGAGAGTGTTSGAGILSLLMTWLPLRPTAMICFSAVTGGLGSILLRIGWSHPPTHIISIASGYGLSMLIGVALPRKLRRSQNTSAAERYELIGLPATVTSAILDGGFGRITYTVRDNTYSAPARHIEGRRVEQGDRVVICEIKHNVYYVTELII